MSNRTPAAMSPGTKSAAAPAAAPDLETLLRRFEQDAWSLDLPERATLRAAHAVAQRRWLERLRTLVEPPAPGAEFPAFLLALPAFARLERAIGNAQGMRDLDTGTADLLQHFVDHFRGWLVQRDPVRQDLAIARLRAAG